MADVEVSTHIDAPQAEVWELINDPTRMGEWSPECQRLEWAGGATEPRVKARFRGHNRLGWRRWTTTCTIVTYEAPRQLVWKVDLGPVPVSVWSYRIDPDADATGCTVVEAFTDRRPSLVRATGPALRGVKDNAAHNRAGMQETLARIKAAAEATADTPG